MRPLFAIGRSLQNCNRQSIAPKRHSSHYVGYRELNYEPGRPLKKLTAETFTGIMFWWIGWHLMTDWKHLIGEFIWPNRCEWTDEELGIPKD